MRLARVGFGFLVAAVVALPAFALDGTDRDAVRRVIDGQIDAFRRDDAGGAYGYAAPSIRGMFPSADEFLAMVKRGYKPVYRPRAFAFGDSRDTDTGVDQALNVQDEDGTDWTAVYSLEKQPDGSWKITGCALVKAPGQSV